MAKLIIVAAAAVLFFLTGLFAGGVVPPSTDPASDRGSSVILTSADDSAAVADPKVRSTVRAGSNPLSFISSTAPLLKPEVCSAEIKERTPDSPGNEHSPDEKRAVILKLIQRQFPDTDAVVAEVRPKSLQHHPVVAVAVLQCGDES